MAVDVGLEPTRRFRLQFSKLLWLPFHQSTVINYSKQPESFCSAFTIRIFLPSSDC
ncbi:hypothetical protein [Escherichia phage vB-Eco-KMB37]|nr:hypothetical protein [Escherichia phage vB-Eco-KMB37]